MREPSLPATASSAAPTGRRLPDQGRPAAPRTGGAPRLRLVLAALALSLMGGCAELTEGPTIVPLTDRSFSIRYLPLRDGSASIARIARVRCGQFDEVPTVVSSHQFTTLDVRETTFRCVADG